MSTTTMSSPQVGIRGTAYGVPPGYVSVRELMEESWERVEHVRNHVLQIPKLRAITLEEVDGVHCFSDEEPGRLLAETAKGLLEREGVSGRELSMILDFSTCSRDKNGVSLCYKLQHELGADSALTLALNNGSCSSLQLAFSVASALFASHQDMKLALLVAEDRVKGHRYHPPAHVLGDGASVVLLERGCTRSQVVDTVFVSIGKFSQIMGVNHHEAGNYDLGGFENWVLPIHYRVIDDVFRAILRRNGLRSDRIDRILYQNMSHNDYEGLVQALGVSSDSVFQGGLKGHGHILASDLVVNYHLAGQQGLLTPGARVVLISSGAGFSWGATLVNVCN